MNSQVILTILVSIAGTGGFAALIQGAYGKRKSNADAASVQVKTALELNGGLRQEIGELRAIVKEQRQRLAAIERRERIRIRQDAKHEAWDLMAVQKLREAGIDLADPPALLEMEDPSERTRASDFDLPGTERDLPSRQNPGQIGR